VSGNFKKTITEGSGSGQGDGSWNIEDAVLLSAATVEYDLTALTRSVFGGSLTTSFQKIVALVIEVDSTSTGALVVGGAAANTWVGPFIDTTDKIALEADSQYAQTQYLDGWPVSGSNKALKLEASGGNVTYSIYLVGLLT
jgi:hypothetical protein